MSRIGYMVTSYTKIEASGGQCRLITMIRDLSLADAIQAAQAELDVARTTGVHPQSIHIDFVPKDNFNTHLQHVIANGGGVKFLNAKLQQFTGNTGTFASPEGDVCDKGEWWGPKRKQEFLHWLSRNL